LISTPPTETPPAAEEPKVEEAKPVEAPAPAPEPLAWEALKLPEGFTVDDTTRDSFLETMNDVKLSPAERAQKLLDLQTSLMEKNAAASTEAWTTQQTAWQDEVRADKEIGGEKLAPVLGEISKVVDKYGSAELREVMNATGAGNNIHVVRFLHNIAKDLGEGGPVSGAPPAEQVPLATKLYPSMKA
jgi:hypothetical protein